MSDIRTRPATPEYRKGFDDTFKRRHWRDCAVCACGHCLHFHNDGHCVSGCSAGPHEFSPYAGEPEPRRG